MPTTSPPLYRRMMSFSINSLSVAVLVFELKWTYGTSASSSLRSLQSSLGGMAYYWEQV